MKNITYLILIILFTGQTAFAQKKDSTILKYPLSVIVFNHSIELPFVDFTKLPVNAGAILGTEFKYLNKGAYTMLQSAEIGFFMHKHLGNSLFLKSNNTHRFTTGFGLDAEVMINIGYLHTFYPKEIYRLNDEGEYEKAVDYGVPAFWFGFGLGVGYTVKAENVAWRPFIRYESLFETPYTEFIPVFPHLMLGFGIQVWLLKNSE